MPDRMRRAMASPRSSEPVRTAAESPYSLALATATASSSPTTITGATGPKISSLKARIGGVTRPRTVVEGTFMRPPQCLCQKLCHVCLPFVFFTLRIQLLQQATCIVALVARNTQGAMPRARRIALCFLLATPVLGTACSRHDGPAPEPPGTLAVAASLRNVAPKLAKLYRDREGGPELVVSYGSSGDLRQQLEGGAPIDAVLFASADPVDELIQKGL